MPLNDRSTYRSQVGLGRDLSPGALSLLATCGIQLTCGRVVGRGAPIPLRRRHKPIFSTTASLATNAPCCAVVATTKAFLPCGRSARGRREGHQQHISWNGCRFADALV
jgi:hypothetical protein